MMKHFIQHRKTETQTILGYTFLGLLSITLIFFLQNYTRFNGAEGYNFWRSLAFNTLTIVPFILLIPSIIRLDEKKRNQKFYWLYHIGLCGILLLLYAVVTNVALYSLGFVSKLLHEQFLLKYFTRTAHIHLILYWLVILLLSRQNSKQLDQPFLQALNGSTKVFCKKNSIYWLESFDHYVKLYTTDGLLLKKVSMEGILVELGEGFIRIHRKYIIQLKYLRTIEKIKRDWFVVMTDGTRLKVSNTYQNSLHQALLQIREQ